MDVEYYVHKTSVTVKFGSGPGHAAKYKVSIPVWSLGIREILTDTICGDDALPPLISRVAKVFTSYSGFFAFP